MLCSKDTLVCELSVCACVCAHIVVEEEDPREQAEEVSSEQREIDRRGTAFLNQYGHETV